LVTARRTPLQGPDRLRDNLRRGYAFGDTVGLLAELIFCVTEALHGVKVKLQQELDPLQDQVLSGKGFAHRAQIAGVRRLAASLGRHFEDGKGPLIRFLRRPPPWIGEAGLHELHQAVDDLCDALDGLDGVMERCKLLEEELAARRFEETNRSLYVLSVITAVFLPLNLVTGIFGMNVGGLPFGEDEPLGFWIIMGAMGILALMATTLLVKRRLF
jgi:zinc transporter